MNYAGRLTIINLQWRTLHGYAGLNNVINGMPPLETLDLLKDIRCVINDLSVYAGKKMAITKGDKHFIEVMKSREHNISEEILRLYETIGEMLPGIIGGDRDLAKEASTIMERQIIPYMSEETECD
jgi:hypothetical protein